MHKKKRKKKLSPVVCTQKCSLFFCLQWQATIATFSQTYENNKEKYAHNYVMFQVLQVIVSVLTLGMWYLRSTKG